MAHPYASETDLQRWMQPDVPVGDSSINTVLADLALESASVQVDTYTRRTWGAVTGDFDFAPQSRRRRLDVGTDNGGFTAISGIQTREADLYLPFGGSAPDWEDLDDDAWESEALTNRAGETVFLQRIDGCPWPAGPGGLASVRVTGAAGSDTYPAAIQTATLIQAAKLYRRHVTPLGEAIVTDIEAAFQFVPRELDLDAKALLEPYVQLSRSFG